jgi:uncharacterized membrane protein
VASSVPDARFPLLPGILFGLGLGGFFDGIVLHQIMQWHYMVSSWYPPNTLSNLELNTRWDGIFHAVTYLFVVAGLVSLWRAVRGGHLDWSNSSLIAALLLGWGIFNLVEGIVDHEALGIHHVNETVSQAQRIYWDIGFLVWGAAMLAAGWIWAGPAR